MTPKLKSLKGHLACPLCQSIKVSIYWKKVWQSPAQSVFQCDNCNLLFIWPQLSQKAEAKYYQDYIKHLDKRGVASKETPKQTFERRKPLSVYRIAKLQRYLGKNKSLLEIGGGCGNVIYEIMRQRFCKDAVLIESCEDHLNFARRKLKINAFLSMEELGEQQFDVICLFHVLEHIRNPIEFLNDCKKLLSPKGVICIEVPCADDPLLKLYDCQNYKVFYFQPMHHYTYSEKPLEYLAGKCRLKSKFIYHQRYPLANHLHWLSKGKPPKNNPFIKIISSVAERDYQRMMGKNKTTDTIFCVLKQK